MTHTHAHMQPGIRASEQYRPGMDSRDVQSLKSAMNNFVHNINTQGSGA
ncbi:hypothetical protein [Ereboglobus luteus]|nr:hypothetical protein [Ereboglobus luteus]